MSQFNAETCTELAQSAAFAESLPLIGRPALRRASLIKSIGSSSMIDQPDRLEVE